MQTLPYHYRGLKLKTSCGKFLNLAHDFPYDVKLRLLAHSRSFLANQKARNAIVGAENLLIEKSPKKTHAQIGLKSCFYLTNRFHVAVRLFSNRSRMTSKCGKKKKWHTKR